MRTSRMTRRHFRRALEDLACRAQLIDAALSAAVFALLDARLRHQRKKGATR